MRAFGRELCRSHRFRIFYGQFRPAVQPDFHFRTDAIGDFEPSVVRDVRWPGKIYAEFPVHWLFRYQNDGFQIVGGFPFDFADITVSANPVRLLTSGGH